MRSRNILAGPPSSRQMKTAVPEDGGVSVSQVGGKSGSLWRRPDPSMNCPARRTVMDLTADQEAEARRIFEALKRTSDDDLMAVARLLASKPDPQFFGATELEVRDLVHRLGARAIEVALQGRKKGATWGPAPAARPATRRPSSSATRPGGS